MKKLSFPSSLLLCFFMLLIVRRFFPSSLLYEQINLTAFSAVVVIYFFRNPDWKVNIREKISQILLLTISISFILNTVLLNVDRSRSFYVLSWVSNNQIAIVSDDLKITVRSKEAMNYDGVKLRLNENISRGLIKENDGGFALTSRGEILLSISKTFANLFNLNNWKANEK